MRLIVGLGNPGMDYVGTRHNVGFEVVDALAERLGWVPKGQFNTFAKSSFQGLVVDGMLSLHSTGSTEKIVLLKPMTYMNESGRAVASAMSFYKITPGELVVIVDEMNLPAGKLRLRPDGSDGGHNGLKSVQQMLGTPRYPRLRFGVGNPPVVGDGSKIPSRDWVLGRFRPDERPAVEQGIARATGCLVTWADLGLTKAMNEFNVKE